MLRKSAAACAALAVLAGCVHQHPAPQPAAKPAPEATAPAAGASRSATNTPSISPPAPPPASSSASKAEPRGSVSGNNASTAKSPGKPPAAGPAAGGASPPARTATASPVAPAPPALDLASLEQRLKDTHAIGVFTKLSLKNQVDDLLADFRAFHRGQSALSLTELRRRFELLLLKVVSLLQESDAQLAAAISSSREAIWAVLVDPVKFAQI